MAENLVRARGICSSAEWDAMPSRLGVAEAPARDLLAIHRVGLGAFGVVDLGGLTLAGLWAARQRLPGPGEQRLQRDLLVVLAACQHRRDRPPVPFCPQMQLG